MTRFLTMSLAAATAVAVWAAPALAAAPANTAPPTISGTPRVGAMLTAKDGTWANNPTSFSYQWQRCNAAGFVCSAIPLATEKLYLPAKADEGKTLRVVVRAGNYEGERSARSAPSGVVTPSAAPQSTKAPVLDGEAIVGEQLTTTAGTWTGAPTKYEYVWFRCDVDGRECRQIQLSGSKNYRVRAVDVGFRLRARVIAYNADGAGVAYSNTSGYVIPSTPITREVPSVKLLSAQFLGTRLYVRFRVCDDLQKNLKIFATDSHAGFASRTRTFSTRVPPNPCGVYTRSWVPARKYRTKGVYTVRLYVLDDTELKSNTIRKSFRLR